MHLSDGTQIDLSAQVAKVKAKTRPWKSIIALILAIGAAAASAWAHNRFNRYLTGEHVPYQILAIGLAVAFCALASAATLGLSGKAGSVLEPAIGTGHAAVVRYALVLIGAVTTLHVTLSLLGIPISQLLLGGALTSVFVGIAAQQSLSNVFAGMVLLLAHPFRVGDSVRLQAGALGGQISGTIAEIGITYLRLATSTGVISIPNSQVLNAVVGPLPDPSSYDTPQPAPADGDPGGPVDPRAAADGQPQPPAERPADQRARQPRRRLERLRRLPGSRQPARSPARHPRTPPLRHPHLIRPNRTHDRLTGPPHACGAPPKPGRAPGSPRLALRQFAAPVRAPVRAPGSRSACSRPQLALRQFALRQFALRASCCYLWLTRLWKRSWIVLDIPVSKTIHDSHPLRDGRRYASCCYPGAAT